MPLAAFFDDQLQMLRTFMEQPQHIVQVIEIDAEFRPILLKMLIGLDEQMDFPHILIGFDGIFVEPKEWFRGLQDAEIIHPARQRLVGNDHRLRHPD